MENFPLINSHNLLANPLLFPTEITNLLSKQLLINNLQGTDVLETLQKGVIDDKITAKLDEVAALVAASLKTA